MKEIGFVASSVSKIAKRANVSPATLYIYYKNKEDLLISTYVEIKKKLSTAMLKNFDESKPFRDILFKVWLNSFEFIKKNRSLYQYSEQFSNSPFTDLVNHDDLEEHFEPLFKVLQKGIDQKVIKDVPFEILTAFIFYPVMNLSNPKLCRNLNFNKEIVEKAFTLAWDAIKL